MATAKIWHYSGHVGDERNSHTQLQTEPYLSRQTVTTSATAASSTASPTGSNLARIEVTVATRYRVNLSGVAPVEADSDDPPLEINTTGIANWINLPPGATVSLIEAS